MRAVILIAALLFAGAAHAQPIGALNWLDGCWRLEDERGESFEVWQSPPLPAMLGYGVTRSGAAIREWKDVRIESRDGDLVMQFTHSGRGTTYYNWTELRMAGADDNAGRVAFANSGYSRFPQAVAYEREGDQLTLTLSGPRPRVETYIYARVACPEEWPH